MSGPGPVPVGTVTFLFSDIEGSTRLEEAVGTAAYAAIRERHRELLRAAFGAHDGQEQGTEGDSFFVVFGSAREAVAAAVEGTRALEAEPWPGEVMVRARIGLHTGEASMAGGSLIGLDVNRAARIAAAAHGGQILASETTRSLAEGSLPAGVSLRDLGEHRLKDLRAATRLYQVIADGLPADFPAPRTLDARPNNLPVQLTSFVGREAELAEARRLIAGTRLLTLTGPGGTGKTRLSLELAASMADQCPDGVFFVPLETIREPSLVAPAILSAIGAAEVPGRPARDVLVEALAGRRVLLVLDNFEQVLDAASIVADLLRSVPDLRIVATSRAALRVSGEQEYPIPGLPVPPIPEDLPTISRTQLPGGGELTAETVSGYESVKLFLARAMAVRPDFKLTDENARAIASICSRLQGMPLAIELAAARVRLLRPDAILARLSDQLALLSAGSRDLPARQQTLRGAIAWSYDILDPPSRQLLDRLSVFVAGSDLEGAESVCGPSGEIGLDVLDGLTALVDQSLVRLDELDDELRFRMLETIREFAAEMLEMRAEAEAILDRREAWFVSLAERAAPLLMGSEQRTWLERLELEHDNIRAVLNRAVALGRAEPAIRLAFAMWRFWQKRGHLSEARRRLETMAAADWSRTDPRLRARLLEALGGVLWWQADIRAMKTAYEEALEIWRSLGGKAELANALYNYSFSFAVNPDPAEDPRLADPDGTGRRALEEALQLYREVGDRRGEANTLWGMGNARYFENSEDAGAPYFRQALEIFREVGDVTMEAWSLHMLGSAVLRGGQREESRPLLRDALRRFRDASDTAGVSLVFDDLASQAVADGDVERAARIRGAGRRLAQETGAKLASFVDEQFEIYLRPSVSGSMDSARLQALMDEGEAMPLDDAIEYALGGALKLPEAKTPVTQSVTPSATQPVTQ
jgi:predicted ATPase/class 3 adenylate cyclase